MIALSQIVVSTVSREGTFEEKETVDLLNGTTIQALLDSGATKSFLPLELLSDFLYTTLNATDDEDVGGTIFDCNLIMDESLPPVKFNFSGAIIEVPISSFADEVEGDEGKCMFGIYQFGLPFALLGDAVLRQAYVVYDMEHHEIGLGQALLNVTGEEESIEVISGEIPKATKASLYSQISALTGGYFSLLSENGVTGGSTYSDSGTSAGTATRIGITGMSVSSGMMTGSVSLTSMHASVTSFYESGSVKNTNGGSKLGEISLTPVVFWVVGILLVY